MEGLGGVPIALFALVVIISLVAFFERRNARDQRKRLQAVHADDGAEEMAAEVRAARADFAAVVRAYETAAMPAQVLPGGLPAPSSRVDELEAQKQDARNRLFDAQRAYEAVRLGDQPSAGAGVWYGSGVLRGWMLGPIGFERAFVRIDHAADPQCWSLWEVSRFRVGFGLGFEEQWLAIFTIRSGIDQIDDMLALGLGGGEIAVRPGFSPVRAWRRRSRRPVVVAANAELLARHRIDDLVTPPDPEVVEAVGDAIEEELGEPLTDRTRLPVGPTLLTITADGPSMTLAAWVGPTPQPTLLASSRHGGWTAGS